MRKLLTIACLFICISAFSQEKVYQCATGQTVSMTASADGTAPFTYQWYKDGTAITVTAATQSFQLSTLTAGVYTVKVSNQAGSAVSNPVKLVLIAPPSNVKIDATIAVSMTPSSPTLPR